MTLCGGLTTTCRNLGALGQPAHLVGDDREAASRVASACADVD
jgi:hypothetical protein